MSTTKVNAAGGVVLSALTILACIYMMVNLIRQGLRKMRVRLLLAAVMSDIAIGLSTLPPQALSVAGRPILTGQRGCNAQAFLYTAALFTQPLMSLFLALATYILIKHPLHPLTAFIERNSCFMCLGVWGTSFLQSGLWWRFIGFERGDTMCSYGSNSPSGLDRNLIKFIPRTFVFIALIVIYTLLFSFLRRPDEIDLSSHDDKCNLATRISRRYQQVKCALRSCVPCRAWFRRKPCPPQQAPWEAVSFVNGEQLQTKAQPDSLSKASMYSGSTFSTNNSSYTGHKLVHPHAMLLPRQPEPCLAPPKPRTPLPSRRTSNESMTMREFFASEPAPPPLQMISQVSAAQYFNRQASLLMLWFPIAYMATFLLSIICLATDMAGKRNKVFSIISLWMILMVGFIDAAVFGVAEWVVKRRTRNAMPSHFG